MKIDDRVTCVILDLRARSAVSATRYRMAPAALANGPLLHKIGVQIARLAAPDVSDVRIAWVRGWLTLGEVSALLTPDVFDQRSSIETWSVGDVTVAARVDPLPKDRN